MPPRRGDVLGIDRHLGGPELDLLNTIVFNPTTAGPDKDVFGPITRAQGDIFGNLFPGDVASDLGGNQFNKDPQLGPLHDNGGPTETMALDANSSAIDAIPASSGLCPATDQRGVTRPQGPACDIGALEVELPQATTGAASAISKTGATLNGTVGPGFTITLKSGGKQVKTLKAGSYSFVIADKASIHNFVLEKKKGGTFEKELTSVGFMGTKTVKIKLTPGQWEFYCRPHEATMQGEFTVT